MTIRAGNPWASGSGSPFMATATIAPRPSSSSADNGVPAVKSSALVDFTASAPSCTPASRSRSRNGTPIQVALPRYSPPTGLDTHVSVIRCSTSRRESRSSKDSSSSRSTIPWIRSRQPSTGTSGTRSAVSTR